MPPGASVLNGVRVERIGAQSRVESASVGVETGPSDARLVERARLGDDDAFGLLVTRYERRLIRVLTRLTQDEETARDLAQDTFWKVYKRLDRFDTSRRFGPWLFRVGLNLGVDHMRRHRAAAADRQTSSHAMGEEPAISDPRARVDLVQEVYHVLERLPADFRSVIVLRDLEGFSSAEVAAIVGRREATIRWRLSKAREMFRQAWEKRQTDVPTLRQEADA